MVRGGELKTGLLVSVPSSASDYLGDLEKVTLHILCLTFPTVK